MNSNAKIVLVALILIIAVFVSLGLAKAQENPGTSRLNLILASFDLILKQLTAAILDLERVTQEITTSKTTPTTIQSPDIPESTQTPVQPPLVFPPNEQPTVEPLPTAPVSGEQLLTPHPRPPPPFPRSK